MNFSKAFIILAFLFFKSFLLHAYSNNIGSIINIHLQDQIADTSRIQYLIANYGELKEIYPDSAISYIKEGLILSKSIGFFQGTVECLTIIGANLETQGDYDSALYYFEEALLVSEDNQYRKGIMDALTGKGKTFRSMSRWQEAVEQHTKCIDMADINVGDSTVLANSYNHLGNIYSDQHQFEKALNYYQMCIDHTPTINRMKAIVILNIGLIHFRLQNLEKSYEYFLESLKISEQLEDQLLMAHCYQKIGFIKRDLGEFDEARIYYNYAIKKFEIINDKSNMAYVYSNIGNLYSDIEDYSAAIVHYDLSLAIQVEIHDQVGQCYTLVALGTSYKYLKKYKKAEHYLLKVRDLSSELGVQLIERDAILNLSTLYAMQKKFDRAYEYQLEFQALNDSIFNETKYNQIAEMEARFESEKKEKEITILNAENEIKQLQIIKRESQRNYFIIAAFVIFILAILLYYLYRIKAKSNHKLKELDHLKSRFFANISHEFRTPLTLILGPLKQKIASAGNEKEKSTFQMMQRNADRLLELINQLLDLSKLEAGKMKLLVAKNNINEFIKPLVASFASLAEQKRIRYLINIPNEVMYVHFDEDKIQKILNNLLSNAFKFTPQNGEVSVSVSAGSKNYSLSVKNTGKGIPKESIATIFERFEQLENSKDGQEVGTGIGLALSKELIELHHGNIILNSVENEYTEFSISIPVSEKVYKKEEIVNDFEHIINKNNIAVGSQMEIEIEEEIEAFKKMIPIVLVVEDNDDVRKYVKQTMSSDYQVITAYNGVIGLEKAIEYIPDLIISDLMMPEMDGIQLCDALKKDERTSHIPLILLTAKADVETKLQGLETGADDYLTKPFDAEELSIRVKNLIDQRKKLRQHYGKVITLEPSEISITPPDETFLNNAFKIVEENIANGGFSVEQFQKELGMSRMQLHRKFKALTDCSTSEFIRNQRLKRAAQLLQSNSMNISEVAYASGFNNLSYFAKCFKNYFDIAPSEYAEKISTD